MGPFGSWWPSCDLGECLPNFSLHTNHQGILLKWRFWCSQSGTGLTNGISSKLPGEAAVPARPRWVARMYGSTALWWSGVLRWPRSTAFCSQGIFDRRVNSSENFSHSNTWTKRAQESSAQGWICRKMENLLLVPFRFTDSPSSKRDEVFGFWIETTPIIGVQGIKAQQWIYSVTALGFRQALVTGSD